MSKTCAIRSLYIFVNNAFVRNSVINLCGSVIQYFLANTSMRFFGVPISVLWFACIRAFVCLHPCFRVPVSVLSCVCIRARVCLYLCLSVPVSVLECACIRALVCLYLWNAWIKIEWHPVVQKKPCSILCSVCGTCATLVRIC